MSAEQDEFWAVYGGIGGTRVAQNLPSKAEAERVASRFADRMIRLPVPASRIWVERQHGRYGRLS